MITTTIINRWGIYRKVHGFTHDDYLGGEIFILDSKEDAKKLAASIDSDVFGELIVMRIPDDYC